MNVFEKTLQVIGFFLLLKTEEIQEGLRSKADFLSIWKKWKNMEK